MGEEPTWSPCTRILRARVPSGALRQGKDQDDDHTARTTVASGRLKARPPLSIGLSRKSPTVAPASRSLAVKVWHGRNSALVVMFATVEFRHKQNVRFCVDKQTFVRYPYAQR